VCSGNICTFTKKKGQETNLRLCPARTFSLSVAPGRCPGLAYISMYFSKEGACFEHLPPLPLKNPSTFTVSIQVPYPCGKVNRYGVLSYCQRTRKHCAFKMLSVGFSIAQTRTFPASFLIIMILIFLIHPTVLSCDRIRPKE